MLSLVIFLLNPILEPPYEGQTERARPLLQYNQTLKRLSEMNISRILSGHGEDVLNVKQLIETRLQKARNTCI